MKKVITTERIPIKMWLDDIDAAALGQAKNLANLPFAYEWIAVMPDCHTGFGMPIGGVLAAQDVIVPNAVGVDIGCGMLAARTDLVEITSAALREILAGIKLEIPVGFKHNLTNQPWDGFDRAPDIAIIQQELSSARRQLGTLGGGNHFIEIQWGSDGLIWLMIHSGSRNFGLQTATFFHKKALASCDKSRNKLPDRDLSYLSMDTRDGRDYFEAMRFCCDFARANPAPNPFPIFYCIPNCSQHQHPCPLANPEHHADGNGHADLRHPARGGARAGQLPLRAGISVSVQVWSL